METWPSSAKGWFNYADEVDNKRIVKSHSVKSKKEWERDWI